MLIFDNKAELIESFDEEVRTPNNSYLKPAVIKVNQYIKSKAVIVRFNKENVFIRDHGKCQYCNKKLTLASATLDHVFPKSRGGQTKWENIVSSCYSCNQKKSNKTPEEVGLKLLAKPVKPSPTPLHLLFQFKTKNVPDNWEKYLHVKS